MWDVGQIMIQLRYLDIAVFHLHRRRDRSTYDFRGESQGLLDLTPRAVIGVVDFISSIDSVCSHI